jgi:hypothetical protein
MGAGYALSRALLGELHREVGTHEWLGALVGWLWALVEWGWAVVIGSVVKLQHVVVVVVEERSNARRCNIGIVYCDIVDIHMQDHMQMFSCENHSLLLFTTYICCILFVHVLDDSSGVQVESNRSLWGSVKYTMCGTFLALVSSSA